MPKGAFLSTEQTPRSQEGASASRPGAAFAASDAVLAQRTYFLPTMAAYVLGLGGAFAANAITHLGQPALLYLVRSNPILWGLEMRKEGRLFRLPSSLSDTHPNRKAGKFVLYCDNLQ